MINKNNVSRNGMQKCSDWNDFIYCIFISNFSMGPSETWFISFYRSNSNSSITSNSSTSAKKQVTSKIASLWKKIEDSKKKPPKKDTRVWIQSESEPEAPRLIRSNTFDNKDSPILRHKVPEDGDPTKRISRLGSFIIMDESEDGIRLQQAINASATTANVVW